LIHHFTSKLNIGTQETQRLSLESTHSNSNHIYQKADLSRVNENNSMKGIEKLLEHMKNAGIMIKLENDNSLQNFLHFSS